MILHKPDGSSFTIDDVMSYNEVRFDSVYDDAEYITLTDKEITQCPDEIPEF